MTMQQFGSTSKLRMTIYGGKEGFGCVYLELVNGAIFRDWSLGLRASRTAA